jgi:hypothetical protein
MSGTSTGRSVRKRTSKKEIYEPLDKRETQDLKIATQNSIALQSVASQEYLK